MAEPMDIQNEWLAQDTRPGVGVGGTIAPSDDTEQVPCPTQDIAGAVLAEVADQAPPVNTHEPLGPSTKHEGVSGHHAVKAAALNGLTGGCQVPCSNTSAMPMSLAATQDDLVGQERLAPVY